jgi:hypothetical protein
MTGGNDLLIVWSPGTDHRGRKHDLRRGEPGAHFGQGIPPSRERFPHQTTPGVIEQVKRAGGMVPAAAAAIGAVGTDGTPISRTPWDTPAGGGPMQAIRWGPGPKFSGASVPVSERTTD